MVQRAVLEGGPVPAAPDLSPLLKECADSLRTRAAAGQTPEEDREDREAAGHGKQPQETSSVQVGSAERLKRGDRCDICKAPVSV